MICAILTYVIPSSKPNLKVAYVSALATKLSDTFASEIGKAYGKTAYLITTFERVRRGTEGAVSIEGTLAGIVGSILLTSVGLLTGLITTPTAFAVCIISAFLSNSVESVIGATLQRTQKPWLTNESVNLINTSIGALSAYVAMTVFKL
jgi:uncharacterized protein (TIGR00297 family)